MVAVRALMVVMVAGSLALGQTPTEKAWSVLETGLKAKSPRPRATAARVLGLITRDAKAASLAQGALADPNADVRAAAAAALGQMGASSSIPALEGALDDKDTAVVLAAANALLKLRSRTAFGVYYEVLTGERKSGQGLVAGQMKTLKDRRKMAQFGFEEGIGFVPFAGIGYSAIRAITKDDVSPVRAAAAKMLASDPDPHSGVALAQAATDKSWLVRVAALDAIAERGDPRLLAAIRPALDDKNFPVQCTAAAAVVHLSAISRIPTVAAPRPKQK